LYALYKIAKVVLITMRILVIGDIHGGLRAVTQIIDKAKVTPNDTLIFLGDYVDGWSQSFELIAFLINLQTTHHCVFIRGNHDQLFLDWLLNNHENVNQELWFKHGGQATVLSYQGVTEAVKLKHIAFLQSLQNYYLDTNNRLFVHAGFTNMNGITYEYFPKLFYWDRTLWETALALDQNMHPDHVLFPKRLTLYHEIYIGHTPVTRIGETIPIQKNCVWNIDTGAAFKGPLTIMDIDTKQFWQSDPLPELYPEENGRN
jgi:serine/threonine protein phosphatase 1